MMLLQGKYDQAKVFTDNIDNEALSQIIELCNQEYAAESRIRIMPDCHAGMGCTIGTTMTITDKVCPSSVGVDIGCGMAVTVIKEKEIDFVRLDDVIREHIPAGFDIRSTEHPFTEKIRIKELLCRKYINMERAVLSLGTLGGGNHFIEVGRDDSGRVYLVVHTGSRHMGKQIADYYQDIAYKKLKDMKEEKQRLVERLRKEGRESEIQAELKKLNASKIKKDLAYVKGSDFDDYIHDMKIAQEYAVYNRLAITQVIVSKMGFTPLEQFTTIHNYINMDDMILRKGAISARAGEKVIIPMNMRDGSLICIGKGNPDWNYSAPHGAGRIMSRSEAKRSISLSEFKESMKGIWTTSVSTETVDESPMVYKPMEEIIENIKDTVEIQAIVKPLYNFKAGGD